MSPTTLGAPDPSEPPAAGVWTLAGDRLIITVRDWPATILVPTGQVRLLAVDLPLPSHARRVAALPFAIEDRIAEPVDSVHLALGEQLSPGRYLVGVVRHEVMARWIAQAEEAGIGHAAMVPDVLTLPRPAQGWAVSQSGGRAAVRDADGIGFEVPAALLRPAWEAAERPAVISYGETLPDDMQRSAGALDPAGFGPAAGAAVAALNLRQGAYAVRKVAGSNLWRKFAWVAAIGAAAHVVIALGDVIMLRSIADRREAETRAAVALAAPGLALGEDLANSVTGLLPSGGGGAGVPQVFLPLLTRVSGALGPLGGGFAVRAMTFEGRILTLDLDASPDAALAGRIEAALKGAGVGAQVVRSPEGAIRITASAA
ncbi:type II secretion system protein GspL [Sphingomonas sp. HITSZ_GF]|uniref:type II secretion system protein GspL n=1 Tax=Sphingomonas sp. HITSZ_GF TaxID=3037247 RepID=UPI00240D08D0|nr:type II secretion system protein GspL [Sphingomonas sp. HITSZ_GF]MDG2533968.1 type II secretion system protein GspL [Sphingomonas sp. HITSZ_GF]